MKYEDIKACVYFAVCPSLGLEGGLSFNMCRGSGAKGKLVCPSLAGDLCFIVLHCNWIILAMKLILIGSFQVLHRWLYLHQIP